MLYIDDQTYNLQQAKRHHAQFISCYLIRKVYGNDVSKRCTDATCKICRSKTRKQNTSKYLFSILKQINLNEVAIAEPSKLLKLNHQFNKLYLKSRKRISDQDKRSIEGIFNYTWFNDKKNKLYNAYDLCNSLKIETCVYCNRLYNTTVIHEKRELIIRPTLDHWFPQNQYPLLALSFYNLIPSCSPCNSSVKHASTFTLSKNIHPYLDKNITHDYQLKSVYDRSLNTFKIKVESKNVKVISTLKEMKIAEIYEHHQSELADLDLLRRKYNKSYLTGLGKLLNTKLTEKEVYRIMFGVEYEDENFHKRPLSKLKKDLLNIKIK
jgi:hypothetical protein